MSLWTIHMNAIRTYHNIYIYMLRRKLHLEISGFSFFAFFPRVHRKFIYLLPFKSPRSKTILESTRRDRFIFRPLTPPSGGLGLNKNLPAARVGWKTPRCWEGWGCPYSISQQTGAKQPAKIILDSKCVPFLRRGYYLIHKRADMKRWSFQKQDKKKW